MIGYLYGAALDTGDTVTICAGGIGYEVHVGERLDSAAFDQRIIWIHEHAPQDAPHELYGFRERAQRDLFRRLLDIKGVGPKVAMAVVASGEDGEGITSGELEARLRMIRGVGTMLAMRIVEELR